MKLLQQIADHFVSTHRSELYRYTFIFPNRRSGVFFRHYIRQHATEDTPILSPEIVTLEEFFGKMGHLQNTDPILLSYRLYICYLQLCQDIPGEREEDESLSTKNFDAFYSLSSLILSDFNDIDKHLADAKSLFQNLGELKELESDTSYLSEEQRQVLRPFLHSLPAIEQSDLYHRRFSLFWDRVCKLYFEFREHLKKENLAYEGMTLRELLEQLKEDPTPISSAKTTFVFVGLNALTPVEQELLLLFKKHSSTLFYWDYRFESLLPNGNALYFKEHNLRLFPSPSLGETDYIEYTGRQTLPPIEVYSVPSSVAQSRVIGQLLEKNPLTSSADQLHTAIVLPNEGLLLSLLNNIPSSVPELNITMGYPIKGSSYIGYIETLIQMQLRAKRNESRKVEYHHADVERVLSNYIISDIVGETSAAILKTIEKERVFYIPSDQLLNPIGFLKNSNYKYTPSQEESRFFQKVFRALPTNDGSALLPYLKDILRLIADIRYKKPEESEEWRSEEYSLKAKEEAVEQTNAEFYVVPHLLKIVKTQEQLFDDLLRMHNSQTLSTLPPFTLKTVASMILTIFKSQSIPFEGEPLHGLQIMGILETRGLDFETLYIPDAQEGLLPPKRSISGIIPMTLRVGFRLPTYEWHEQVRAYHFYRLISSAKRVVFTYDTRKNRGSSGEVSRFIRQLDFIYGAKVSYKSAHYPLIMDKSPDINREIDRALVDKFISEITAPDSNRYLSASSIKRYLSCPRQFYYTYIYGIKEETGFKELLDPALIGSIIHRSMNNLYRKFLSPSGAPGVISKEQLKSWLNEESIKVMNELRCSYNYYMSGSGSTPNEPRGFNNALFTNACDQVFKIIRTDLEQEEAEYSFIDGEKEYKLSLPAGNGQNVNFTMTIDRLDTDGQILRIVDYKSGKDETSVPELKNGTTISWKKLSVIQLLLYCEALLSAHSDSEAGKLVAEYEGVCPMILKTYDANPINYFKLPKDSKDENGEAVYEIRDYERDYRKTFLPFMQKLLAEIINPNNPYTPNTKACRYCHMSDSCWANKFGVHEEEGDTEYESEE
ncbi:MAG: PD-(D/E)XK nuclease family protein [Porphyromonas sp.]|nr:PD-(D/E)XK nuclease family protein [Porphyromonas sp.]